MMAFSSGLGVFTISEGGIKTVIRTVRSDVSNAASGFSLIHESFKTFLEVVQLLK